MKDEFLTLAGLSEGYYIDKGSKFLSYAFPVSNENEATQFLQKIKKEHPKARHYCTAMRLFPDASIERSNDDGEPSGSAGKSILNQLIKNDLTNAMIVVIRYFGGTKLGIPGLIEAYKTSASNAISKSQIIRRKVYSKVRIELAYEQLPGLINHFKQNNIPVFKEEYDDKAFIIIGFKKSGISKDLIATLRNYSQMDFNTMDEYEKHLKIKVEMLHEDEIL